MNPIIDEVQKIIDPVYLVGGSVRDTLLGYTPKDFDLNRVMADVLRIVEAAVESNCRVDKIV